MSNFTPFLTEDDPRGYIYPFNQFPQLLDLYDPDDALSFIVVQTELQRFETDGP